MNYFIEHFKFSFFVIILLFVSIITLNAQDYNSARLTVLYGSNIPFNFNTIDKIKNGITVTNGTKFGITMKNLSASGVILKGFDLTFKTFNNQSKIKGDVYEMNLDKIQIKAENALGLESGFSSDPLYQPLSASEVVLFTYIDNDGWIAGVDDLNWISHQLNISYECGKESTNNLMGVEPDYYNVEIEFELIPRGDGF